MRPASVFVKAMRDQRWQMLGFGTSLMLVAAMDVYIWPSYRDTLQNFNLPPALQAFLGTDLAFSTGAGFLSGEFFSWIPILLIVFAVTQGTGAIAGEEGSGTMDLLLAQPIERRAVIVQKVIAVLVGTVLIIALGWVGFLVSIPFVEIGVSLADTAIACANMLPIVVLFFALSLWAGVIAPSRGLASAIAIGVATATYFISTLGNGVAALRDLRYATPFYYYGAGTSLVDGINWWHVGLLLAIAAVFIALAVRSFERRDVSVGGATDVDVAAMLRRIFA
jgi:ABC-2 type transport system permease protein